MKIAACIKQVPDTSSRVEIGASGTAIERTGLSFLVNPYDEFAVEEALRIKERTGHGEVTVLSVRLHAEQKVEEALRTCLAMGADKAVLLKDEAFLGGDSFTTATVLAAALGRESFDLILFGKQAVDTDAGAVGIQVAELLGLPHVSVVERLEPDQGNSKVVAQRQIEGGVEIVDAPLPAVITCQKGLNEPRYPNLPGIMKAKKKPLDVLDRESLGLEASATGSAGARTERVRLEGVPGRPEGRILEGDPATAAKELVRVLAEEEGVL